MGRTLRILLAVVALVAAAPAGATIKEVPYLLTVDATSTGDDFRPAADGWNSTGSASATWTGAWGIYFRIDRDAKTATVQTVRHSEPVAIVNSYTETAGDGGSTQHTCSFADVPVEGIFGLDSTERVDPTPETFARGTVEFTPINAQIGLASGPRQDFECTGSSPASISPSESTVPGISRVGPCAAPFTLPLDRVGEERIVLEQDVPAVPTCRSALSWGNYTGHVHYTLTLDRQGGPPPDLLIRRLSGDAAGITVELSNAGREAAPANDLLLEGAEVAETTGAPRFSSLATGRVPALDAGDSATVAFPASVAGNANLLRATVDSGRAVREKNRTNNRRSLWKLGCPAIAAPPLWLEVAETGDRTQLSPPDYAPALAALPSSTIEEKARAILCYIQLEGQRRAKSRAGTMRGSKLDARLATYFLKDYLADPGRPSGRAATKAIGAPATKLVSLPVPDGIRKIYPALPRRIYPGSEFLADTNYYGSGKRPPDPGKNHPFIRFIDGPFLVGDRNNGVGLNDDWGDGGRNHTNVMHWATGVRYGRLPPEAFRALFIGYELLHLEGWDVFGEDAINDLIAEDAGRMLGRRILRGSIKSHKQLTASLDADFREARAWVGAMIRLRLIQLDGLILRDPTPTGLFHWTQLQAMGPWSGEASIVGRLANGETVEQVRASHFVDRLVQIYTLVYDAEEWQRRNGSPLTRLETDIVNGVYDAQFRSLRKNGFFAEWEIKIKRH